jgi:glucose/arabinose dehydrogenase
VAGCASGTTEPATDVTDRAATLRATGKTGGDNPTTWWFEYGKTTSYGTKTPQRTAGTTTAQQSVSERVTGLAADTTYHFRACASNAAGSGCGADRTLRTGSPGMLPGFQETTVFSGLEAPTAVRFAPDGRIFVAEKPGGIKVFDGAGDTTPTTVANLRTNVNHNWDRGMLALAVDPRFPAKPFIYVLYTYDAPIGGTAPTWNDQCPTPPGPTTHGCVSSARLSRIEISGNQMVGAEQVLIEDWCQQGPTHTIGDLHFGADGALYVSAGDAASPDFVDYGQMGMPANPCGDPPVPVGTTQTAPAAEGGALRSQDLRTPADPTTLDGALLRVNPDTGDAMPGNPLSGSADPGARRIVGYGLRNPFRFAVRPGTNELWLADVGWNTTEEINRVANPLDATVRNFGWPCYEGAGRQSGYDGANLSLCESLYAAGPGAVTTPYLGYAHAGKLHAEDPCPTGTSSTSGMAFTPPGSPLPGEFAGALFFADYARACIWVMEKGSGTLPNPALLKTFRAGAATPVDIQFGPGGDLFYANVWDGQIRRIRYTAGNQAPRAVAEATPTSGNTPLAVSFSAGTSSDPDGDPISYAWDLDGDGAYDDSTSASPAYVYTSRGVYQVGLRVTDSRGASTTDAVAITAGNTPPVATITAPTNGHKWDVADTIHFEGSATDSQEQRLGDDQLSWTFLLHHCPSSCHTHEVQSFPGTDWGDFDAPDHEYPSYLELRLTATDSGGLSDTQSVRLDPRTVQLAMRSTPSGLQLTVNGQTRTTPFDVTVIEDSSNTLSATTPQTLAGATYDFGSWSDGGLRAHGIVATLNRTYTATFSRR